MVQKLVDVERIDENTVRKYFVEDDNVTEQLVQNVDPVLEINKNLRNEGYDKKANIRKIAEIPMALIEEWKNLYGFDWFNATQAERAAILNNPDFKFLRTTEEKV